jgi:hypothetical protein
MTPVRSALRGRGLLKARSGAPTVSAGCSEGAAWARSMSASTWRRAGGSRSRCCATGCRMRISARGSSARGSRRFAGCLWHRHSAALAGCGRQYPRRKDFRRSERNDPQWQPGEDDEAVRQEVTIQSGLPIEKSKEIVRTIKDSKIKVQASIQGDVVRVSSKSRDLLQEAIQLLRGSDFGLDLQFTNYRTS